MNKNSIINGIMVSTLIILLISLGIAVGLTIFPQKQRIETFKSSAIMYSTNISTNVTYPENISETNKEYLKFMISAIQPIYLVKNKNITFVDHVFAGKNRSNWAGYNVGNGQEIFVRIDSKLSVANILCHELLHSYFDLEDSDLEEDLVIDGADALVCFYETNLRETGFINKTEWRENHYRFQNAN